MVDEARREQQGAGEGATGTRAGRSARGRPSTEPRSSDQRSTGIIYDALSALLFGVLVILILASFRDYGITWDESWHLHYGDHIVAWYASGFENRAALSYHSDYLYGGGFDATAALFRAAAASADGLAPYDVNHLLGACVGVLGILGAWRLGRLLYGPAGAFWSALLLSLTPVYYGHMFNNPKDIPFAAGYVWAMVGIGRVLLALPRVPTRRWVELGFLLGAALCVRVGGILTICYLLLALGLYGIHRAVVSGSLDAAFGVTARLLALAGAASLGAWSLMLVAWPWALLDPLRHPFEALGRMTAYNLHHREMPFGELVIRTTEPPWDYLPRYFLFKLPVLHWALLGAAAAIGLWTLWRALAGRGLLRADIRRPLLWFTLLLATAFPPSYAIVRGSTLYDGLRHFLFLIPLLAVFAASAVVVIARALERRGRVFASLWLVIVCGACVDVGRVMVHLHPHQYVFFNRLVGGLPGAFERYDTDYYGESYKRLFAGLYEHLWTHEREALLTEEFTVTGCIPVEIAREYERQNIRFTRAAGADFFVGYQREGCLRAHAASPVIYAEQRQGATLPLVRDLRPGARGRRSP